MPYKPQVGERKHRGMIGDCIAENEIALDDLRALKAAARTEATVLHIQKIEIRLLENNNRLRKMLDLVRNGGECDPETN